MLLLWSSVFRMIWDRNRLLGLGALLSILAAAVSMSL